MPTKKAVLVFQDKVVSEELSHELNINDSFHSFEHVLVREIGL